MNDVTELKQYVGAHALSQSLPPEHFHKLLDRVRTDEGGAPGSWAGEWCRAGERLEQEGHLLEAVRHFNMARFPYVDGPARAEALERCVSVFDRWRKETGGIERLDVDTPEGRVGCWTSGLSDTGRKPLLIFMGGIVSIKEQWAPLLGRLSKLGFAGLVTEIPGVGENGLPYHKDSWRLLPRLLDAVQGSADVANTYCITLSFSGHLAMRAALEDDRIRGVMTVGAPVNDFFTDRAWQAQLPRITVDTLAHLTGVASADVGEHLRDWALSDQELRSLPVPLAYAASARDEIIPAGDPGRLRRTVPDLRIVEYDDVHGAPSHLPEMQMWGFHSILRMKGGHLLPRAALRYALLAGRLRRRPAPTPA
ncbi:alpha/beta hydrolase [Streptomyces monomycini]|uniref:alpha/beta hydrolase n=1 Tax=Streptomyces monomycini TaxID=371720 RepID=UPI0005199D4A|nr:alpha/beta hydrolase [Streptomyces monomycini]